MCPRRGCSVLSASKRSSRTAPAIDQNRPSDSLSALARKKRGMRHLLCVGALLLVCVSGCGRERTPPADAPAYSEQTNQPSTEPATSAHKIAYTVRFLVPDAEKLLPELKDNSQLVWLNADLPDSRVALERRMLEDVETARKILRSRGYYDGTAQGHIDWDAKPALVELELNAGRQYVIGTTAIRYRLPNAQTVTGASASETTKHEQNPVTGQDFMRTAPGTLTAFGLPSGAPAEAGAVLDAVSKLMTALHDQGYPLAAPGKTRYIVDRATGTFEAGIEVATGPLVRMGGVTVREERGVEPAVSPQYLTRLATWNPGQFWDDRLIRSYRTALQETGLFSSIGLEPGTPSAPSPTPSASSPKPPEDFLLTPVDVTVRDAPPRTISGGMQYSTDTGLGARGTWENRNLFGSGEHLRVTAPLSMDLQLLTATFRKPAFGAREQTLVGEVEARNETSDAYDQTAIYTAGGLERRFSGDWRNWWGSARVSLEAGKLDDHLQGSRAYSLFGIPLSLRRDTTDDLLNPTSGTRANLTVTPYTGTYDGALATVRTRLDASAYMTPFATSRIVLAARFGVGSLSGGSVMTIPASLRFYAGGGGSVRGYKYQSLGPHDIDDDPVGGLSFTDVGLEARFRITEHFGIVPFIDGGMVYESAMPKWGKDMAWGAGLGFRYYTAIGPIRLDVATPLQNRDKNKAIQIYFSIGQAF